MESLLDYLPILAAAFGIPQYLPQIVKLRVTHDTAGVSWSGLTPGSWTRVVDYAADGSVAAVLVS